MHPLIADDEPQRLAALRETGILDTRAETDFDDTTALAADICDAPIAMVSMVDADRQWFKARVGWDPQEIARDESFCTHVVRDRRPLETDATTADPRFATNPAIDGHGVRFYAGAPMLLQDGHAAGTVCVMDRKPRHLTLQQRRALRSLARPAAAHLELRRYTRSGGHIADRLRELDRLKDSFPAGVSHELRTPLSSVRGYIEVLLDEDEAANDPETVRRLLAVMQRNADRLVRLIDDLLPVARLHETGVRLVDTGIGVPAEDLPHVFDRFHRSSTADHLAAQGAGLGLTIVKAIIDAHHGDITVTSAPGEGTTVCHTLPAVPAPA